jgi:hypothetical protein
MEDMLENVGSAGLGGHTWTTLLNSSETSKTDFIKYTKNLFKRLIQNFQKVYYYRPERPTKKAFSGSAVRKFIKIFDWGLYCFSRRNG